MYSFCETNLMTHVNQFFNRNDMNLAFCGIPTAHAIASERGFVRVHSWVLRSKILQKKLILETFPFILVDLGISCNIFRRLHVAIKFLLAVNIVDRMCWRPLVCRVKYSRVALQPRSAACHS